MPDLSIIIVNYKGWKRLKLCLDSLAAVSQNQFSFEVNIVDNASGDGILADYRQMYRAFNFIENQGNYGFANGCNLGARHSKGEILLFLNPDTIVTEKSLSELLQKMHQVKENCIVSCRQLRENGTEEKSNGEFISAFALTGWMRAIKRMFSGKKKFQQDAECIYPDWVSGSVLMISQSDFKKLSGWDEDFWMYHEDVDFCKRARDKGMNIILLKNTFVEHNHGGSSRTNPSITALTKTEVYISRHLYITKHSHGIKEFCMHLFLIVNNLITLTFSAFFGFLFFFNRRLKIYSMIYTGLIRYYLNSLLKRTWMSHRSVNY